MHRTWFSLMGIMKSKHSRRALPMSRSQNAFACGARYGVFNTHNPEARSKESPSLEIDAVAGVNVEFVTFIAHDAFPELLHCHVTNTDWRRSRRENYSFKTLPD